MFVVMFVIINVAYFAYGSGFAHHQADEARDLGGLPVARIPEAKVYDPQGLLREERPAGPVLRGHLVDLARAPSPTAGPT